MGGIQSCSKFWLYPVSCWFKEEGISICGWIIMVLVEWGTNTQFRRFVGDDSRLRLLQRAGEFLQGHVRIQRRLNSSSHWHHPFNQSSGKQAFHPQSSSVFAERFTIARAVTVFKAGVQGCHHTIVHSFPFQSPALSTVPVLAFQTSLRFSIQTQQLSLISG